MLNGTGHAHRNIEPTGARRLAGLSDLTALGQPTGVRNRPGTAERRADGVRQFSELRDLGFLPDTAADGQDELGGRHVDVISRAQFDELASGRAARCGERGERGGRGERVYARRCGLLRRLVYIAADGEQYGAAAGDVD